MLRTGDPQLDKAIEALETLYKQLRDKKQASMKEEDGFLVLSMAQINAKYQDQIDLIVSELQKNNINILTDESGTIRIRIDEASETLVQYLVDELVNISAPAPNRSSNITVKQARETPIPTGRTLFRGDDRAPSEVFTSGFKRIVELSDDENVLKAPYVSETSKVMALTPWLNTAAVFPTKDEPSDSWVYVCKVEKGVPITMVSENMGKAGIGGLANYPAEVVTREIPPRNIICALKVHRNNGVDSTLGVAEAKGTFTINEIIYNGDPKNNPHIDAPLREYLKYLETENIKKKIPLPFALGSQTWKTSEKKIPDGLGLRDIAQELIAQKNDDYPKAAVEAWLAILPPHQTDRKTILTTIEKYPNVFRLLNGEELFILLKRFPNMENRIFNRIFIVALKNSLPSILASTKDGQSLNYILKYFIENDIKNEMIPQILSLENPKYLSHKSIATLLKMCSDSKNDAYKNALLEIASRKLSGYQNTRLSIHGEDIAAFALMADLLSQYPDRFKEDCKAALTRMVQLAPEMNIVSLLDSFTEKNGEKNIAPLFAVLLPVLRETRGDAIYNAILNPVKNAGGVKKLLINRRGQSFTPYVVTAARAGNFDLVKLLISNGAILNDEVDTSSHDTALIAAIKNKHPDIVELLLLHAKENGRNIGLGLANQNGETALSLIKNKEYDGVEWKNIRKNIIKIYANTNISESKPTLVRARL